MNNMRWCIVLPPEGAARMVAIHTARAFTSILSADNFKAIDSSSYLHGYKEMLKTADDTLVIDLFNQSCAIACLDFQATHVLVTALSPITLFTLLLLRKYHVVTCFWFYEDYYKAKYWQSVLPGFDHFFAIQHGAIEKACEKSDVKYHFLPTASGGVNYPLTGAQRTYDVVFIGIPSPYRISILEALVQSGIRLVIAGAQWNTYHGILEPYVACSTWINDTDAFQLMQKSKIGLNLSFDDPEKRSDIHISPRIYDLVAAGCIVVSEETPLLHEALPDIICHTFSNRQDAVPMIASLSGKHHLLHDESALNISAVKSNHGYANRVGDIIRLSM